MKLTLQEKYNNAQLYWTLYASVKKKKKKKKKKGLEDVSGSWFS